MRLPQRSIRLAVFALAAGIAAFGCRRGEPALAIASAELSTNPLPNMHNSSNTASTAAIPRIDAEAPTTFATATFALG